MGKASNYQIYTKEVRRLIFDANIFGDWYFEFSDDIEGEENASCLNTKNGPPPN